MLKTRSLMAVVTIFALALTLGGSVDAEARQGWGGWGGKGKGKKKGHGYALKCSRKLFRMPPVVLQKKLGLDAKQLKKIVDVRNNYLKKKIDFKRDIAHQKLKLRFLMETDLPDVNAVLKIMRAKRAIKSKLKEEKIKAKLWAMAALTAEQRTKVRKMCRRGRWGGMWRRFHRRGGKGMGPGRGMGPRAEADMGGAAGTPVSYDMDE